MTLFAVFLLQLTFSLFFFQSFGVKLLSENRKIIKAILHWMNCKWNVMRTLLFSAHAHASKFCLLTLSRNVSSAEK